MLVFPDWTDHTSNEPCTIMRGDSYKIVSRTKMVRIRLAVDHVMDNAAIAPED